MKLSTQPYKGTRDFYPEDMRLQAWMLNKWREVSRQFGYEEYDGPILEPLELFTAKTSEEIVNEQSYSFTDRGDRKVIMRPEMTPTVSRMVAGRRQELGYPLRLFSIPNCFRYEQPQRGRLREFWQYNADIFGVKDISAEVEIILLIDTILKAFGADSKMYSIRVNSRKLLNSVFEELGIADSAEMLRLIDKKDKLDPADFAQQLAKLTPKSEELLKFLNVTEISQLEARWQDTAPGKDLKRLFAELEAAEVTNAQFVPAVARGFEYYTDIVFEVFDENPDNNRALCGGGRYDGLVAQFGVDQLDAIGVAMSDIMFETFLRGNGLLPKLENETDIYVAVVGDAVVGAQAVAQKLRAQGKNVAVDLSGRKLDKQIRSAEKKGIKQVLFIGEQELESGEYKLKNLDTGKEETLKIAG